MQGLLVLENPVVRLFDEDMENRRLQIRRGYGQGRGVHNSGRLELRPNMAETAKCLNMDAINQFS